MKKLNKTLLTMAITASLGLASTSAMAFNEFTVQESGIAGAFANVFTMDKINGTYLETVSILGANTFSTSLRIKFQGFSNTNNGTDTTGQIGNVTSNQYGLYLLYTSVGTYAASGAGFEYTTTNAIFNLYSDSNSDTSFTAPAIPLAATLGSVNAYGRTGQGEDQILATGNFISGSATQTCSGVTVNNNCGSFGQTTTFSLTAAGSQYFIAPTPFFDLSLQSGNFNGFEPIAGQSQEISGVANAIFQNSVPEPTSIALLGLGLLGLGMCRQKQAK